jgi:hypothetical protein
MGFGLLFSGDTSLPDEQIPFGNGQNPPVENCGFFCPVACGTGHWWVGKLVTQMMHQ